MNEHLVKAIVLGWIASIAVDFFLNAGVFASYFSSGDQFILSSQQAFIRIPAGYASILFLVGVLGFLIYGGTGTTPGRGMRIGLIYGVVVSSSSVLGLWSITEAPVGFLTVLFVDQLAELTVAGAVISIVRSSSSRHITRWVVLVAVACVAGGVILQNILG